jgi:hypothetical protein
LSQSIQLITYEFSLFASIQMINDWDMLLKPTFAMCYIAVQASKNAYFHIILFKE